MPPLTLPDSVGHSYPATRRFRAAIPNLRFKSGVRFELANAQINATPSWRVSFYYGNAKQISEIALDEALLVRILRPREFAALHGTIESALCALKKIAASTDGYRLQRIWARQAKVGVPPYDLVDVMGIAAGEMMPAIQTHEQAAYSLLSDILEEAGRPPGAEKVLKNAVAVLAGFIVGASFNSFFPQSCVSCSTLVAAS
jgi:DNA (cytosine-5)-methyltransferase 1